MLLPCVPRGKVHLRLKPSQLEPLLSADVPTLAARHEIRQGTPRIIVIGLEEERRDSFPLISVARGVQTRQTSSAPGRYAKAFHSGCAISYLGD